MITMTCLMGEVVASSPVVWPFKEVPAISWKSAREAIPMRRRWKALDATCLTDIHSPCCSRSENRKLRDRPILQVQCLFDEFRVTRGNRLDCYVAHAYARAPRQN